MRDFDRIERVIYYLDQRQVEQPSLTELAQHAGLSPSHFQRLFARWAGITPKQFLQCLTMDHAKRCLRTGASVLEASWDAGLSGPGRLHDLCVKLEAASPGEVKSGGAGWTIRAGVAESPFGSCLIAESPRGICHLSFLDGQQRDQAEDILRTDWPAAEISWDDDAAATLHAVFRVTDKPLETAPLRAVVRGTPFQVRVWRALLSIPPGALASYGSLAESLGDRAAARAVGTAIGQNQLAYLIPCHRVIQATGRFGEYRWGTARKRAIVAWESNVGAIANRSDSTSTG